MGTLYDLLGALPSDDAEELRAAFRKAAKSTHPDINPDDPDASLRFRELMRAYDILTDVEQRATYDHLLAIALQPTPTTKSTRVYETIRKVASNTMAATIVLGLTVGGYTLLGHFSTPPGAAEISADMSSSGSESIAAETATPQSDSVVQNEPRVTELGPAKEIILTIAVAPAANEGSSRTIASINPAPGFAMHDAKPDRERGIFTYRNRDMYRTLADLDLAIQHDPGSATVRLNRSIFLYRAHEIDRAFANIPRAKRSADLRRPKAPLPPPRNISPARIDEPARRTPMIAAITP